MLKGFLRTQKYAKDCKNMESMEKYEKVAMFVLSYANS